MHNQLCLKWDSRARGSYRLVCWPAAYPIVLRSILLYPRCMPFRDGIVPPVSEVVFRRRYFLLWLIAGAASIAIGLFIGPRLNHSHNPWISVVVAVAVYAFSIILCKVVLLSIWRRPDASPAVLFFSIPVGGAGLATLLVMRAIGPSFLFVEIRWLAGLTLAISLLYAAALIWGIGVGIQRKKLGDFWVERRP